VEGELELEAEDEALPPLELATSEGGRLPVHAELVAAGAELASYELPGRVAALLLRGFPEEFTGLRPCAAAAARRDERLEATLWLGEEVPARFEFAAEREALAATLEGEGDRVVRYRVLRRPRVRLAFVDELPGHGLGSYRLLPADAERSAAVRHEGELRAERRADGAALVANGSWRVEVGPDGRVDWQHGPSGCAVEDALCLRSEGDRGDEYTFDPVPGETPGDAAERPRIGLGPGSGASVAIWIEQDLWVPAALAPSRRARSAKRVRLPVRTELRLWRGLDRLDVSLDVTNTAEDHRLRLLLAAPFAPRALEVESAFEVVERPLVADPAAFGPNPAERPSGASPQRGFASLRGDDRRFTVANRGAAEVEAVRDDAGRTALAVTLLRAVGWLSRDDLGLRPVHAGPALETPGAQVPGRHRVELAVLLHEAADPARGSEARRFSAPPLAFPGGVDAGPLAHGARLLELDAPGVRVSAIEPMREGGTLVRLYEAEGTAAEARLRFFGGAPLEPADLSGAPHAGLVTLAEEAGGALRLGLRAHQIVSLLRRPPQP
ncbi:MAG: hypothetical protein ACR2P8_09665, partial [Myxococcota bacterium]